MSSSLQSLNWRYATKQYDTSKKLTDEQRNLIIDALRLSPSSFGLQPWKFIHVTNPEVREKLKAASFGQPQLTDASDIFVLCSTIKMDKAYVDQFIEASAKARNVPVETLAGYRGYIEGAVMGRPEQDQREWNGRQVYIPLGIAMAVAAENGIDTSPMEGFDPKQFDEILGLSQLGIEARVILAAGFRSPEDATQNYPKVRFSKEDVVIER